MITKANLVLDETQSHFVADAILLLAGIIKNDPNVYKEAAQLAARCMAEGTYTLQTVAECVDMVGRLADKWDPEEPTDDSR